jgi:glycosylphosphatidylinositol transamidase (GPIT) subunit GPI8
MDGSQPAILFLSGHGNTKVFLFQNGDAIFKDELQELYEDIARKFKSVFVIVDSCRSG